MNLYLVERKGHTGYDEYSGFVCRAEDEWEAAKTNPNGDLYGELYRPAWDCSGAWVKDPQNVTVTLIGATEKDSGDRVILASFHAG